MKKSIVIATVVVVAVFAVLLVTMVKRVPGDAQGVLIAGDGSRTTFTSGTHFVTPFSGTFITYPVGVTEVRSPLAGAHKALTKDGLEASIALELRLQIADGTGDRIYDAFGEDLLPAIANEVKEAIEIETARWSVAPQSEAPPDYIKAVAAELMPSLNRVGMVVSAARVAVWEVTGQVSVVAVDEEPARKVIFVGVDGADWNIIRPLIAQGRLPNFKRLVEEGATGPLRSMEPMLSPLLWTTMATGKLPEDHGILNFTVPDPETGKVVPISRLYRKVDAFWNMLSDYDRSVDVIGWLATFPAEPINGVMVTDRVGYLAYADAGDNAMPVVGSVSPDSRRKEISELVMNSSAVSHDPFSRFVQIDRDAFVANRTKVFDPADPINNMIMIYASTQTYRRIANHLLEKDKPDVLAVYYELPDATKHLFMQYAPPRRSDITEVDYEKYRNAVTAAYVLQDEILGEMIDRCDENTVLIVASDHGFKSGGARPKLSPDIRGGHAASWHHLDGIICLYGGGIRRGHKLANASVMDIAPTVLALQGLPKPADMPGKILEGAFTEALAGRLNRERVVTLQRPRGIGELAKSTGDAATDAVLKKLEALGYISSENPDAHNNLGQRYQKEGKFAEAIEEFKKALALRPNFPAALNNLGVCYGRVKRYPEAEQALKKALSLNPKDYFAMNNLAIMYLELGQLDVAMEYGRNTIATEPNYPNGHLTLGSIYATMRKFEQAEQEFRRTLELEPSNRRAQANIEKVRTQMNAN